MDHSLASDDLLNARYDGAVPHPAALPDNPVFHTMLSHRSVRAFLPDALPAGLLESLIAAGQSAPTSSNMHSWSVVAVRDPARKSRLAELSAGQGFIRQAPLFLCFLADNARMARMAEREGVELEGLHYLESLLVASIDAALAAQNVVVAAESVGLGTVYVGSLRTRPLEVAEVLELPPGAVAMFGLCVGYPDPAVQTEVKPRLPQSVVLHQERYQAPAPGEAEAVARYDASMTEFSLRQGMGAGDGWIRRMINRLATPASLNGRATIQESLRRLGFPLR